MKIKYPNSCKTSIIVRNVFPLSCVVKPATFSSKKAEGFFSSIIRH